MPRSPAVTAWSPSTPPRPEDGRFGGRDQGGVLVAGGDELQNRLAASCPKGWCPPDTSHRGDAEELRSAVARPGDPYATRL